VENRTLKADALDFWIGRWSLSWAGGGKGTNTIQRILRDRVIEEMFEGGDSSGELLGRSFSVVDSADGRWRQTWVDSNGSYLDFVGVEVDGAISFQRTVGDGGQVQRMRWLDISHDRLTWLWERSDDLGATWALVWEIGYQRLADAGV
jgi:hypothetical protein